MAAKTGRSHQKEKEKRLKWTGEVKQKKKKNSQIKILGRTR